MDLPIFYPPPTKFVVDLREFEQRSLLDVLNEVEGELAKANALTDQSASLEMLTRGSRAHTDPGESEPVMAPFAFSKKRPTKSTATSPVPTSNTLALPEVKVRSATLTSTTLTTQGLFVLVR